MSIFYLISSNNKSMLKNLLGKDINQINTKVYLGSTRLFYAVAYGDKNMIFSLLLYNPDMTITDKFGLSIYDYSYLYDKIKSTNYKSIIKYNEDLSLSNVNTAKYIYGIEFVGSLHIKEYDEEIH